MALLIGAVMSCLAISRAAAGGSLTWQTDSLKTIYDPGRQFYCYAPSILVDARGEQHIFACRNHQPRVIRDHIYHFIRGRDGSVGQPQLALSPGRAGAWDSYHVCDPSVVAGRFRSGGKTFRWAMFYLGNDVNASRHNQIGVAFADALTGPWERLKRPIVPCPPEGKWGAGQPSAISIDHASRICLFYTTSQTPSAWMCRIDFSDSGHPRVDQPTPVPTEGLINSNGRPDRHLNNYDVAQDRANGRILIVREQHPYPHAEPHFISTGLQLASIDEKDLFGGKGTWRIEGEITPQQTGFARNHNPALARDAYGAVADPGIIQVFFSSSAAEPQLKGLFAPWTYVLHEIDAPWRR